MNYKPTDISDIFNQDISLSLRDVVFIELRKEILTGELKPGDRLMEIHLAKRLGVSRTPIREAIRKLEIDGLVTMSHRKGAVVSEITKKHLKDVLEVRRTLDGLAIELACDRINEEEKIALKKARLDFEVAIKQNNIRHIAQSDVEFHDIILKATRNERLIQLISNLSEQIFRYRFEYIKDSTIHQNLIDEHQIMCDAVLNNDKDTASKYARIHIDNQEKAILRNIDNK